MLLKIKCTQSAVNHRQLNELYDNEIQTEIYTQSLSDSVWRFLAFVLIYSYKQVRTSAKNLKYEKTAK